MGYLNKRFLEEKLSDNSHVDYCAACQDCNLWNDGTIWSSTREKSSCQAYPYPGTKPMDVIFHQAECRYKVKEGDLNGKGNRDKQ